MSPPEPPKPSETQVRKRRTRKVTLAAELRQADKAGKAVKAADVYDDAFGIRHVLLTFGEDEKAMVTELQAWKAKRNAR